MNTKQKLVRLGGLALTALVCTTHALAVADADVSAAAADADLTWDVIRPLIIGIGVFTVAYAYFKRMRRA